MKISKLFHWLYAILMLLPFLVFLPNAFYYGFNEHAVSQETTGDFPIYYDSNDVNNVNDLVPGNVYLWTNNFHPHLTTNFESAMSILITENLNALNSSFTIGQYCNLSYSYGNDALYLSKNGQYINLNSRETYLVINSFNVNTLTTAMAPNFSNYSNKVVKEYVTETRNMSITDSMSYAWDSVWQNDLFSWSYGSFLTEPFIYIGNVFNVPEDNSLYYALSYWLDISIIWLCFDVIMYVPLLVHRWLDKGIVE